MTASLKDMRCGTRSQWLSAGGRVADWYDHSDLSGRQVEPLHSSPTAGGPVETTECRPA